MEPASRRPGFTPPQTPLTRRLLVYFASGAYRQQAKATFKGSFLVGRPSDSLSADALFRVGISPADRACAIGVSTNVFHKLAAKIGHGSEDTASNHIALDLGKPDLDLIQPRRVGRSEVKAHLRMIRQKLLDRVCLMRRQVVENNVNLPRPFRFSRQFR